MAQAFASIDIPAAPDQVWKLIGGFGSLPDWIPAVPASELAAGGRVRRLPIPPGHLTIERLVAFDDVGRSYTYTIVEAPFPVSNYLSTLRVLDTDAGKSSRVEWSGRFTPNGVSDEEASKLFRGVYENGLEALARAFGRKDHSL